MLITTKGIVIKQTKFSDSGAVIKIFTNELGIQSFFVRGLHSQKATRTKGVSKNKAAMFQPLTMLDMVVSYSVNKSLHNIKEISIWYAYQSLNENMIKRTLLFFINELLHKSLKEETENKELFNWIHNSLVWLDLADKNFVNFHLVFMMQLSMFLGFYPKKESASKYAFFDMQEGRFCSNRPIHQHFITEEAAILLSQIQDIKFENSSCIKLNNKNRKLILEILISYYKIHMPSFGEFKSMEVLSVVLND